MFKKRISPAMALLFLGPICGELISGHQSLFGFINPVAFLLTSLPYGFGAIICRELMIRWGKSWPSLILLGLAYGLYEEFIVARSVWDPDWAELGAIRDYSYWEGVMWTYAAVLLHFHLLISILASIGLAHLLYPDQRHTSWVNNRQLTWCFVGLALWAPALWLFNPFIPTLPALTFSCLAIAGLIYLARQLPASLFPPRSGTATKPLWYGVLSGINMTFVFLAVFLLPESDTWADVFTWPVIVAFVVLFDALMFGLILYWSGNGYAWDDRHRLAFIIGLLAFFTVFGFLQDFENFGGLSIVAVVTIWALRRLWLQTKTRILEAAPLAATQ